MGMDQNLLLPYERGNNHPFTSYDLGYRLGTVWVYRLGIPFGYQGFDLSLSICHLRALGSRKLPWQAFDAVEEEPSEMTNSRLHVLNKFCISPCIEYLVDLPKGNTDQ